ncbi:MAG TPA: caspase family protein, partial [Ktedonobacteraceae bacterium]|nr:caspase family protein [Ktedonobacteraceae bacterium]
MSCSLQTTLSIKEALSLLRALVVGVNTSSIAPQYWSTLKYAEKDAQDMASLLARPECSFILLVPALIGEHATSGSIKQRVIELVRKRQKEDFLLFYYAGHAIPIENDIYFITHDFREEHVEFDPDLYLSMRWLWKVLYQSAGAGRVLLILDCCYAGNIVETKEDPLKIDLRKLFDEWNAGTNGKEPKNCLRLILTATGHNNPAQEQDGHGLMTGYLLQALRGEADETLDKDGHVDIRYLHKYLQEKMPKEQAPDLAGKFGPHHCIVASYPEKAAHLRSQRKGRRGAEHPQSYIPFPRNPLFQPRPGEFERLETLLTGENAEQPTRLGLVGVTGMGGIGKTQLAVELAYRLQEQQHFAGGIFWTPATGTNVFEWHRSMAELAFNADYLPPDDDPSSPENEARRACYFCRYLANHADVLLILDNVEDPKLVTSALPFLAGGSLSCSILYTSRMTQTPHGVVAHSVEQLPQDAALRLLLETTRPPLLSETLAGSHNPDASAARSVCFLVGYMPLALVHLRSFLQQDQQVSLCRLVDVFTSRGISGIAAKVTETFRLSWQKVRTEAARHLFLLASSFPEAAPIPLWLLGLASGLGENGDIFEPLGQARFHLLELSLLEELSNKQVRLHPLVRAFGQQ